MSLGSNSLFSIRERSLLLPSVHLEIMKSPVAPHEPPPTEPGEHCSIGSTWQSSRDRRAAKALVNVLLMDHNPVAAPRSIGPLCSINLPCVLQSMSAQRFTNTFGEQFLDGTEVVYCDDLLLVYCPIMVHAKFLLATCSNKGHL